MPHVYNFFSFSIFILCFLQIYKKLSFDIVFFICLFCFFFFGLKSVFVFSALLKIYDPREKFWFYEIFF